MSPTFPGLQNTPGYVNAAVAAGQGGGYEICQTEEGRLERTRILFTKVANMHIKMMLTLV